MKVKREKLLRSLEAVSAGLSTKEIIEQSNAVVFVDGRAVTFNDEISCSVECDVGVSGAVTAVPLMALLRKLPDEEIDLEVVDGELVVKGDHRKSGIKMAAEVTLPVDGVERPGDWINLNPAFVEAVRIVQDCASRDESQFVLTCIHIHPERVEATDSFQLARYPMKTGLDSPSLIRRVSMGSVLGMAATKVSQTENWLHFRNDDGLVVSCRRYADNYVKPEILDSFLSVDGHPVTLPKGLEDVIGRAEVFSSEDTVNQVTVSLKEDSVVLTGQGATGWHKEKPRGVVYKGDEMSFTISPRMLVEILRMEGKCKVGSGRLLVTADKWSYVTCVGKAD